MKILPQMYFWTMKTMKSLKSSGSGVLMDSPRPRSALSPNALSLHVQGGEF